MADIYDERAASIQAAQDIFNQAIGKPLYDPKGLMDFNKNKTQPAEGISDKEARKRAQAESMARRSGGVSFSERRFFDTDPIGVLSAWVGNDPKPIKEGKVTPKQFYEQDNYVNYTGVVDNYKKDPKKALSTNSYTKDAKDDFVSAWFSGRTPMAEFGVAPVEKRHLPLYKAMFGTNYADITSEKGFRAYQTSPETLNEAPILNDLVDTKLEELIKEKRFERYPSDETSVFRIGNTNAFYDAKNHTKVSVILDGKTYSKDIDVFDVKGLDRKIPIVSQATKFIDKHSSRYFVTTPWYEDNDD